MAPILAIVARHVWPVAALSLVAAVTTPAQSPSLTVAIVRFDGYLIPFAAYASGRWERAWPAADEGNIHNPTFENTPSVWRQRGQPVPRTWHVWPTTGTRPLQARVTGVDALDSGCQTQVALKTDLSPLTDLLPQDRIALDSGHPVNKIEELLSAHAAWKMAERVIVREFSAREAARARTDHVQLPSETPAPPVRIKHLYREAHNERSPIYFVAEREYHTELNASDVGCKARTTMTGWLIRTGDAQPAISASQIFLTDCDGVEVRTASALAVLRLAGRVFWVLEESGYEDTEYLLVEITASGIRRRLAVNGGAC